MCSSILGQLYVRNSHTDVWVLPLFSYLFSNMLPHKFQILKVAWNFAVLPLLAQHRNSAHSSSCSTIAKCHRWKSREILVNHWPHIVCLPFLKDHSPTLSFVQCLKIVNTIYFVQFCSFFIEKASYLVVAKSYVICICFFSS